MNNATKLALSAALFVSGIQVAFSYQSPKLDIRELVERSETIGHAEIVGAREIRQTDETDSFFCGYVYMARVREGLTGATTKTFEFSSYDSLEIGGEYVIFASTKRLGARAFHLAMGKSDELAFARCGELEVGLSASRIHGEVYEIVHGEWLKVEGAVLNLSGIEALAESQAQHSSASRCSESKADRLIHWPALRHEIIGILSNGA